MMPARRRMTRMERTVLRTGLCALLACLEVYTGASYEFASLNVLFLILTFLAVDLAEGPFTIIGFSISFMAAQQVIVSQIGKFLIGQQTDDRLAAPIPTMLVYCLGMVGVYAGLWIARLIHQRGQPIFRPTRDATYLSRLAIAALAFAAIRNAVIFVFGVSDKLITTGGLIGPLRQLECVDTLGLAAATAAIVVASKGRRLLGGLNFFSMLGIIALHLVSGERSGMIMPVVVIVFTGFVYAFRFRPKHFAVFAVLSYVFVFIISPFSLRIRDYARTGNVAKDLPVAVDLFLDVVAHPGAFQRQGAKADVDPLKPDEIATRYYQSEDYRSATQNLWERFALIRATDAMVDVTLKEGTTEWVTITPGFLTQVPSFLLPDKPVVGTANMLAHRVSGWVGRDDYLTQITFGFFADSFSSFGWYGTFAIPLVLLLWMALLYRKLVDQSFWSNVWVVAILYQTIHAFSEGTIATVLGQLILFPVVFIVGFVATQQLAKLGNFKYLHRRSRSTVPTV